ncbi:MAG: hypothetical protein ACTMIR_06425 [Cellulomonadaceae bacterium]
MSSSDRGAASVENVGIITIVVTLVASACLAAPAVGAMLGCSLGEMARAAAGASSGAAVVCEGDEAKAVEPVAEAQQLGDPGADEQFGSDFVSRKRVFSGFDDLDLSAVRDGGGVASAPAQTISDDPNDERCRDAMPSGGEVSLSDPRAQVGCSILPVPVECQAEWRSYTGADAGADRRAAGVPLGDCMKRIYSAKEQDCVVASHSSVQNQATQILFYKVTSSHGMLFETLSDGRVRTHILRGSGKGGGISLSYSTPGKPKLGVSAQFGAWMVRNAETDTTYEFKDMQDAQSWAEWYEEYNRIDNIVGSIDAKSGCYSKKKCNFDEMNDGVFDKGEFRTSDYPDALAYLTELRNEEPQYRVIADSRTKSDEMEVTAGVSGPASTIVGGEVSGKVKSKTAKTVRDGADGTTSATLSSTDSSGLVVLATFSGSTAAGLKLTDKLKGGADVEWAGTTSVSAAWSADGRLEKIVTSADTLALSTARRADTGGGLAAGVFGAGVTHSTYEQQGTQEVIETVIDLSLVTKEARAYYEDLVTRYFPRDEAGELSGKAPSKIEVPTGAEQEEITAAAVDAGGKRTLSYDVEREVDSTTISANVIGIDLFSETWTDVTEDKELTKSSLEIVDVNETPQTVDPAPKCNLPTFAAPDDYYAAGAGEPSNPPTKQHPAGSGHVYYQGNSKTA